MTSCAGSEPTEPLEPLLQYTQALRDVPQQQGFPESWRVAAMPVIRYVASVLLYHPAIPISTPAAFIVSTWTRPDDIDWGGWFGTYDNPPQGDRKWLKDHPELRAGAVTLNRVGWIRRNRLYGLKRFLAVDYTVYDSQVSRQSSY